MNSFKELQETIKDMPIATCTCGGQDFKKVAEGYNQFKNNEPVIEDIVKCNTCDKIYIGHEYDDLPRKQRK